MAQSLSNILLHIIFSTKDRRPYINEEISEELYSYICSISASNGAYLHKIGGIEDHIHILMSLPRILTVSNYLEEIKKNSSKWIKQKGSNYRDFSWQKGYGVFSVSASQHEAVMEYIANQKERHKKISFKDEFRKFLKLNNVSFDEKYVWE